MLKKLNCVILFLLLSLTIFKIDNIDMNNKTINTASIATDGPNLSIIELYFSTWPT